jgi:hypothetical protein
LLVNLFAFMNVYCAPNCSRLVEEVRGVLQRSALEKGKLDLVFVGLSCADAAVVGPNWGSRTSAQSGAPNISVNSALSSPTVSPSSNSTAQGQSLTLTANATSTGTSPYTYQWFSQAPGATAYSLISGASSLTYNFATTSGTAAGNWNFILQTTDNAGDATNSTAITVAVTAVYNPTPNPSPTAHPTSTPTPTSTLQPTATPSPQPTATASPSPTPSAPSNGLSTETIIILVVSGAIILLVIGLLAFRQKK